MGRAVGAASEANHRMDEWPPHRGEYGLFHFLFPLPFRTGIHKSPWLNYDPARPVSDIKELDYDRRWIIYRDEEPKREIREFRWEPDCRMYQEPANCYEDYYKELYEYFHD